MGSIAFVMAELVGLSYVDIIIIAIIPSFLFFLCIFLQTDLHAVKAGIKGIPDEERPSFWPSLKLNSVFVIAILALVFLLIFVRMDPAKVALYISVLVIMLAFFKRATRPSIKKFKDGIYMLARLMALLTPLLAAAGMVLGAMSITGLALTLGSSLAELAKENIPLMLMVVFIFSFIMGMVGQATATYIILAILVVLGMITAGIYPLGAHFFVIYCALLSFITPPVAYTVFPAAALADANYWKSAWQACRLAIVAFIMPFMFVYQPAILLHGTGLEVLQALGPILVAIVSLSFGVEGYIYKVGRAGWPARAMLLVGGFLLIPPGNTNRLTGIGLIVLGIIVALLMRKVSPRRGAALA